MGIVIEYNKITARGEDIKYRGKDLDKMRIAWKREMGAGIGDIETKGNMLITEGMFTDRLYAETTLVSQGS